MLRHWQVSTTGPGVRLLLASLFQWCNHNDEVSGYTPAWHVGIQVIDTMDNCIY